MSQLEHAECELEWVHMELHHQTHQLQTLQDNITSLKVDLASSIVHEQASIARREKAHVEGQVRRLRNEIESLVQVHKREICHLEQQHQLLWQDNFELEQSLLDQHEQHQAQLSDLMRRAKVSQLVQCVAHP